MSNTHTTTTTTGTDLAAGLQVTFARYADDHKRSHVRLGSITATTADEAMATAKSMAEAEACMSAFSIMANAARWFSGEASYDQHAVRLGLMSELLDLATMGADDTWSGRANDIRRTANDAKMRAISVMQSRIFEG